MLKRKLGKTGLSLPILGFGAMEIRSMDSSEAGRLLNEILDMGIAFIDTSPDYIRSEEHIGRAISHRRGEYVLASKCGCDTWTEGGAHVFTRERFQRNLDASLKTLKTDRIDIWQIHGPVPGDLSGPFDDAIAFMQEQKDAGKVGTVSVSFKNGGPSDPLYPAGYSLQGFELFADWGCFDSIQTVYGALTRDCEHTISRAAEKGIGVIARGVLNRYTPAHSANIESAGLRELCATGEDINEFLIRFAITHEGVTTAIVGSGNAVHMRSNIAASGRGPLPADVYAEAKCRLDAVGVSPDKRRV